MPTPTPPIRFAVHLWRWPGRLGIRARLMLLVVALALPFLLCIGALVWSQARDVRSEALSRAESMAALVAVRVDDFVEDSDVLARLVGRIAAGRDRAALQAFLDGLRSELRPYVVNVAVWNLQGELVAAVDRRTLRESTRIADRAWFRDALQRGGRGLEAPVKARGSGEPTAVFARPILDAGGRVLGVVSVAARLSRLAPILDPASTLPSGMVVTLLDRAGNVVSRSQEPGIWIGRNMRHVFDAARFTQRSGSSEILGVDQVQRISGYATLTRAPWKVYVGIPTGAALARLWPQAAATLALGAGALAAGLLLALFAGNGITARLRRLADAAARLEAGQLEHRSDVGGHDEIAVLGNALDRMAHALHQRSEALTRSTEELGLITDNVPVLIAYVDADERYRFANEFHRDIFGVPPERLIGRTLGELFVPEVYARLAPRLAEVLSGLPASFEASFDAGGGAPWFLVSCFPDYRDDHRVRGFYAVCQDITRRRQAEEALAARERFTQLITDTIPARITYLDAAGRVQFGNRQFAATWGVLGRDFTGQPLSEVLPPHILAQVTPYLARGLAGEALHFELAVGGDGNAQHDIVRYVPDIGADGRVQGVFTISQDVTALKRLEAARVESERRIRLITDNVPAAMAYVNRHERFLFANTAFVTASDMAFEDLIGRRIADVLSAEVYAATRTHIEAVLAGTRQRFQRLVPRKGGARHELVEYIPERDAAGEVTGFFALIQDITDLQEAQDRVEASEHRLRKITENIPALICYIDRGGRYRFNSRYYEEWLGRPLSEITGRTVLEVLGPRTFALDEPQMQRAFAGERVEFETHHTDARGTRYVRGTYVPDFDAQGNVAGIFGATTDVTSLKEVEKQLERLAQSDSLTGLPNRNQYNERIGEALARMRRTGLGVGLLFLDIDAFKGINDTRGHAAGDEVLREFARRLSASVRETDTVARLAGDEFVVLLEGVHRRDECLFIARKIVAAMRRPFRVAGIDIAVTTSIGIALTDDAAMSAEALLQRADSALYAAKAQGRDRYEMAI